VCKSPCAQYTCGTTHYWNCESDGNLHSCDASGNKVVTDCKGAGCKTTTGTCTNDTCNPPPACKPYACGTNYVWSCEADGNLHKCDANGNVIVTDCKGAGCQNVGNCADDLCGAPSDAGADSDAGTDSDAGADTDASSWIDGGEPLPLPLRRGCGCSTGFEATSPFGFIVVAVARGRRRRRS
jgi:MYXO-CTERM domain-containing protein